ncbi:MAG: hypothetical protein ACJ8BW_18125 [Ktedonobacteraceae bacterium]
MCQASWAFREVDDVGMSSHQELTTEPWGKWAQFTDLDTNEFGIWAPAW